MLLPEQIDFYMRWQIKANAIEPNHTEASIDKYVTLYIIYNSLYNIVFDMLLQQSAGGVRFGGDKLSATRDVIEFLGSENILLCLQRNNVEDIDTLRLIIHERLFNLAISRTGHPQRSVDARIGRDLISKQPYVKALAILDILYHVRCNVFHGRKGLQSYQQFLLVPVINIINNLNSLLFNALSK